MKLYRKHFELCAHTIIEKTPPTSLRSWSLTWAWHVMGGVGTAGAVVDTPWHHGLASVVYRSAHEVSARVRCVGDLLGFGELDHRLLQIVERTLNQHFLLLVEVQQVVPQLLL